MADYEWVTHEAIISKDEVGMASMGHRDVDIELRPAAEPIEGAGIRDPEWPGQEPLKNLLI